MNGLRAGTVALSLALHGALIGWMLLGASALYASGAQAAGIATWSRAILQTRSTGVLRRHMPHDAAEAARQLFAVLRDFDAAGVSLIWVETPPDAAEWDGVRDRLQRAAAA